MAEEETTDSTKLSEATPQAAEEKHSEAADQPGATTGHGVEASHEGFAPPDTGQGEAVESEVPTGVDELPESAVQAAQERGGGGGDEGEGGDSGALDVSALMEGGGDAGDEGAGDEEEEDAGT